ncbi:hypothetical protein B0H13DRAFT_1580224, partial [Mycena leptocephala]
VSYKPYLCQQFTICYDLYLEICRRTGKRVLAVLGRSDPKWRLKHACPACMYELVDEEELTYHFLFTMDGGESLRRVLGKMAAKYPLAIVDELLDMFGKGMGLGYDIGCHFEATIKNSRLSDQAK